MSIFKIISDQIALSGEKKRRSDLINELKSFMKENITYRKEEYPEYEADWEAFGETVSKELDSHMPAQLVNAADDEDIDKELIANATTVLFLSENKMYALACMLPPINGGRDMTIESFEEDLKYAGITCGIDLDKVKKLIKEEEYMYPFMVAAGEEAVDGRDGEITDCFQRVKRFDIQHNDGDIIDFEEEISIQIVQKDQVLCYIKDAEKGKNGRDVVGNVLAAKDGEEVEVNEGPNTYLSIKGTQLHAAIDGALSITDEGDFCVDSMRIVNGEAGRHTGNLYADGDMYISGSVKGDIIVKAGGDLIIAGEVRDAQIRAGKSLRIQKGATKSEADTLLVAEGQIQCSSMENVKAEAGGSIFCEVSADSDLTSGASVYANTGRGLIVGGDVKAKQNINAKEIGNIAGCSNMVQVGYEPGVKAKMDELDAESKEINETLEKLQKNITNLKALGSKLPQDKKELLAKLEEQRMLYEEKSETVKGEIKALAVTLHKATSGMISCDKLYPTTLIKIGEKKTEVKRTFEPCRAFVQGDSIVVR